MSKKKEAVKAKGPWVTVGLAKPAHSNIARVNEERWMRFAEAHQDKLNELTARGAISINVLNFSDGILLSTSMAERAGLSLPFPVAEEASSTPSSEKVEAPQAPILSREAFALKARLFHTLGSHPVMSTGSATEEALMPVVKAAISDCSALALQELIDDLKYKEEEHLRRVGSDCLHTTSWRILRTVLGKELTARLS